MSTSDHDGRIVVPSYRLIAGDAVSSRVLRVLTNNAHHYADEKCHHLVNWIAPASGVVPGGYTPYLAPSPLSAAWTMVTALGPFPLTVHGDRSAYDLRLELLAASSLAGTAVYFAGFVVDDPDRARRYLEADTADAGVIYNPTTSTTPAWLTAAIGSTQFRPARSIVDRMWGTRSTLLDTGGAPASVDTVEAFLVIVARRLGAAEPRLYGVHLSEYVGT